MWTRAHSRFEAQQHLMSAPYMILGFVLGAMIATTVMLVVAPGWILKVFVWRPISFMHHEITK